MRFVDTNILIYSVCFEDTAKSEKACDLLDSGDLALSVQVFQEFYTQVTRPSRSSRLTHAQAIGFIDAWLRFPVQAMTVPLMQAAFSTKERWQISYWDAAIIEAARSAGCAEVLSEDLQSGQSYGGVRVVNPFI
jgi:predicted nucleic acid-binding protein